MTRLACLVPAVLIVLIAQPHLASEQGASTAKRAGVRKTPAAFVHRVDEHQPKSLRRVQEAQPSSVIEVFKDHNAWFGENRDEATLLSLGKVPGVDYFVHPLAELAVADLSEAAVVLLTSNGVGAVESSLAQNDPAAQANLLSFASRGGVVIIDMGDNDHEGGYRAPGSVGTPTLVFPSVADNATLAPAARGADGAIGTSDDHRLVRGSDAVGGTGDDLDDQVIDACCYVAHGNLSEGVTLPRNATVLMTATFDSGEQPILAEYCLGSGRVIVDTITKEYAGQSPQGEGPATFLSALLSYALDPSAHVDCQLSGLLGSVGSMVAGERVRRSLEAKLQNAARQIAVEPRGACGMLTAFRNEVNAQTGKGITSELARQWTFTVGRIQQAVCRRD